jgi:hypothetical protein
MTVLHENHFKQLRFHRSLAQAFADDRASSIEDAKGVPMTFRGKQSKFMEFLAVYRLYRRGAHSHSYSLRRAYTIVYRGWSF